MSLPDVLWLPLVAGCVVCGGAGYVFGVLANQRHTWKRGYARGYEQGHQDGRQQGLRLGWEARAEGLHADAIEDWQRERDRRRWAAARREEA